MLPKISKNIIGNRKGRKMKKLLVMLIVVGILIGTRTVKADFPKAFVAATDITNVIIIGKISNSADRLIQANLTTFLQQERRVGAISRYNYNNLTSPYIIGKVPTNQVDWMKWHVMNVKLGKYFEWEGILK